MTALALPLAAAQRRLDPAAITIVGATLFNMALCLLFTIGLPTGSAAVVAGCEICFSAIALVLARSALNERALLAIVMLFGFLLGLWMLRQGSGPKIVRDLMIPFAYYFLGLARGTPERADRLVRLLLLIVLAVAIVECFDLGLYTRLLDVNGYFLQKGMISTADADKNVTGAALGLYISGVRLGSREFLPFLEPILGLHRASSVFLEPIELSNFSVIAYAWLLCRFRSQPAVTTLVYMAICFALIAMCDSRFASMICIIITLLHLTGASRRTLFVALLPIAICGATLLRTLLSHPAVASDDLMGRLYISGSLLASFTWSEWFGLRESLGPTGDAGYAYLVTYAGFLAAGALWVFFLEGSGRSSLARSMRGAIAIYATSLLAVSYSLFSIKTAALLWYLYGTVAAADPSKADV